MSDLQEQNGHARMAGKTLTLLSKDGLMISAKQAREFVELLDWLEAIKEGALVVGNKANPEVP